MNENRFSTPLLQCVLCDVATSAPRQPHFWPTSTGFPPPLDRAFRPPGRPWPELCRTSWTRVGVFRKCRSPLDTAAPPESAEFFARSRLRPRANSENYVSFSQWKFGHSRSRLRPGAKFRAPKREILGFAASSKGDAHLWPTWLPDRTPRKVWRTPDRAGGGLWRNARFPVAAPLGRKLGGRKTKTSWERFLFPAPFLGRCSCALESALDFTHVQTVAHCLQ